MKIKMYVSIFVVIVCIFFLQKKSFKLSHQIFEYTLLDEVHRKFNDKMQGVFQDPYGDWEFYKKFSKKTLLEVFPQKVIDALSKMHDVSGPRVIILHNVPIDQLIPESPRDGKRPADKTFISESVLLGFCSLLNSEPVVTYSNANMRDQNLNLNNQSSFIHQIIPLDDERSKLTQSSSGSAISFDAHTEAVQFEQPIKFFLLYCLRGDPQVATNLIFLDDLLLFIKNNFNLSTCASYEEFVAELKKPQFIMRDSSDIQTASFEIILPILIEEDTERIFRFNSNGSRVEGVDEHAQSIVDYLKTVLSNENFKKDYLKKFYLKKGDLLIFNNLEILHARDSFTIDVNNWRWLQRVYCCSN